MPRVLAMARASYGPTHSNTMVLEVIGDGGGFTKNRTRYAGSEPVRWSVLGLSMVDARGIRLSPPKKRRALRAYRRLRSCPSPPPLGVVAPHRTFRLVWRGRALLALVPYSPGLPSPQPNRP
jgi:hypothetical protein